MTDHRIGLSRFGIDEMLAGVLLDDFAASLKDAEVEQKLLALEDAD